MKLYNLLFGVLSAWAIASAAQAQSTTGAIEQLPIRTLSHLVGHDGAGRVGREPVTDFLKPGSASPTSGNIATWGTSGYLLTDGGQPLPAGTLVGTTDTQTLTNKTLTSPTITGGTISGITDLAVADGGTGASNTTNARANLGLLSMSTQSAGAVAISGGTITGITDLAVADGGTGASTAPNARSNLGAAASGVNGDITSLTGLTTALSIAQGGTNATSASAARTSLGAASSGSNSDITSLSGLTTALSIAQGGTAATTAANARTNLGLTAAATMNASTGGSFTPTLAFGGASTGITYTTQTGAYSRVGPLVFFRVVIVLSSKGTATGSAVISGLPISSGASGGSAISNIHGTLTGITGTPYGVTTNGTSTIQLFSGSAIAAADTNFANTTTVNISGVYDVGSL